jgi:hypothetical protein
MKRSLFAGFLVSAMLVGSYALADMYDPNSNQLSISSVQFNGTVYTGVVVKPSVVLSVGGSHLAPAGGETSAGYDNYDGNFLTIPSVQLANTMYTDVTITVGSVLGFAGSHPAALAADPNPGGQTWRLGGVALGAFKSTLPFGDSGLIQSEIVALPTGAYRMYVGGVRSGGAGGDIWMAESDDGANTWHLLGIAVAGSQDPQNPEFSIAGPSIVGLADGRWRMYYQGTPDFDGTLSGGALPSFQLFSALSSDGLTWTKEGVRIPNFDFDSTSVMKRVAHGRVVPIAGGYVAIVSAKPKGPTLPGIYRFFSSDGLTFTNTVDLVLQDGHDPFIVNVNGQYLMYADTSPNTNAGTAQYGVLLRSQDAIVWSAPQPVAFVGIDGELLHFGGAAPTVSIGDISGVVLANGRLRLFANYCCDNIGYFDLAVMQ